MKYKLTGWYDYGTRPLPERVGVYNTIATSGIRGYCYWNGERWSATYMSVNAASCMADYDADNALFKYSNQMKAWRGLREPQGTT
jgi:hypothetical protein